MYIYIYIYTCMYIYMCFFYVKYVGISLEPKDIYTRDSGSDGRVVQVHYIARQSEDDLDQDDLVLSLN